MIKQVLTSLMFIITIHMGADLLRLDPLQYREGYPLGHVVSIDEAVFIFEQRMDREILLPSYFPFEITYAGGNYNPEEKSLLLSYLNENTGAKMKVFVQEGTMPQQLTSKQSIVKLNHFTSKEGIYETDPRMVADLFYFYDQGLEYLISISKRPIRYEQEETIKVAESFR